MPLLMHLNKPILKNYKDKQNSLHLDSKKFETIFHIHNFCMCVQNIWASIQNHQKFWLPFLHFHLQHILYICTLHIFRSFQCSSIIISFFEIIYRKIIEIKQAKLHRKKKETSWCVYKSITKFSKALGGWKDVKRWQGGWYVEIQ